MEEEIAINEKTIDFLKRQVIKIQFLLNLEILMRMISYTKYMNYQDMTAMK